MKRYLITLLAALALPTAVNAESVWLILKYSGSYATVGRVSTSLEKMEMKDMDQCQAMGNKWTNSEITKRERQYNVGKSFECLYGK